MKKLCAANNKRAELPPGIPATLVFNKIDTIGRAPELNASFAPPRVYVSATGGQGLGLLRTHLKSAAGLNDVEAGVFAARRRHLTALRIARDHTDAAARVLMNQRAFELFAEELRLAQQALGEITGTFSSEDLLGAIFGSFCIGK